MGTKGGSDDHMKRIDGELKGTSRAGTHHRGHLRGVLHVSVHSGTPYTTSRLTTPLYSPETCESSVRRASRTSVSTRRTPWSMPAHRRLTPSSFVTLTNAWTAFR